MNAYIRVVLLVLFALFAKNVLSTEVEIEIIDDLCPWTVYEKTENQEFSIYYHGKNQEESNKLYAFIKYSDDNSNLLENIIALQTKVSSQSTYTVPNIKNKNFTLYLVASSNSIIELEQKNLGIVPSIPEESVEQGNKLPLEIISAKRGSEGPPLILVEAKTCKTKKK